MIDTKFPKKIHPAESHYTYNLAVIALEAITKSLSKEKDREALDGDDTEAICARLLKLLDSHEGNK